MAALAELCLAVCGLQALDHEAPQVLSHAASPEMQQCHACMRASGRIVVQVAKFSAVYMPSAAACNLSRLSSPCCRCC